MSYNPNILTPDAPLKEATSSYGLPLPNHCPATLIQLSQYMVEGMYVAGGSCITILNPSHQYGDFDVYVNGPMAKKQAEDFLKGYSFKKTKQMVDFLTEWSDGLNSVQLIEGKQINSLSDLLSTFDLDICRIGFDTTEVLCTEKCERNIADNTVTMSDKAYNDYTATLFRLFKYASKGYKVSQETSGEFINALSHKLTNEPVLTKAEVERRVNNVLTKRGLSGPSAISVTSDTAYGYTP